MEMRLWEYPYVVVRVSCHVCRRHGSYRLARLADKHGSDIPLDRLLEALARDCPWRDPAVKRKARQGEGCGAHFPDVVGPRPPDLPPGGGLRLIPGGKAA